jgi:ubiquitin C-terminal hydrolase
MRGIIYNLMDKAQAPTDPEKGFGGLTNMGLTCYGNAVIQNLRHLSKLNWVMEEGKYNTLFSKTPSATRQKQQDVARSFAEVVQFLGKCKRGQSVRPGTFWKYVTPAVRDTMYEHLAHRAPHDSHEFFLFLLDSIHGATAQEVDMKIIRPPATTPQEELVHGALEAWQREFSKEYSPFVHMFYGVGHWRTTCHTCKNVSHRWESFTSLKVPIPQVGGAAAGEDLPDIMKMLHAEMQPEKIDGYQCDKCAKRTEASRYMSIWRLPLTLVLVMKRFTPDGRKISTRVAPLPQTPIDFGPYFSEESPERKGLVHYTLRGIVDHHGSAGGGHYTAQCKHTGNGVWHVYDDEGVGAQPNPHFGESTYMMFLERESAATAPAAEA